MCSKKAALSLQEKVIGLIVVIAILLWMMGSFSPVKMAKKILKRINAWVEYCDIVIIKLLTKINIRLDIGETRSARHMW
jgi:hypothetical protein